MKQFIDLSVAIENNLGSDPDKDLPDGNGWALELMTLSYHSGTHLDVPFKLVYKTLIVNIIFLYSYFWYNISILFILMRWVR